MFVTFCNMSLVGSTLADVGITHDKGKCNHHLGREIMYPIHRWRHRVATAKGTPMSNEGNNGSQGNTTDDDFKQLEQASQTVFGSK